MSEDMNVVKEQDEIGVQDNSEQTDRDAVSLGDRVQKVLDQKFADYADPKIELQVMHDYLSMGLNMSGLNNSDTSDCKIKTNIFDVKKIKGIANKICTASRKLQDDALEIALSNLKLLVNYLKIELESLSPMNEDIVEALQIMFDEKQTFFQNHTIEEEKVEPEKESQSTQDKSSSSQPKDNEPASTESNKEQNLDLLGIDDGNKADDEEMEDQSKFFDIRNDKDEQNDDARRAYNPEFHISVSGADENDHENINALYENDRERMQIDNIPSSFVPMAGDYVDAIKIEPGVPGKISIWEEAQIIQDTGVSYKVEFMRDEYKYTREIEHEFWEESICPRGTHTKDSIWRYKLQENVGSYVDYFQVDFGW